MPLRLSRPLYRESFEHDAGGILAYGIPNMKLPKELVRRRIDLMTDEDLSDKVHLEAQPTPGKRKCITRSG